MAVIVQHVSDAMNKMRLGRAADGKGFILEAFKHGGNAVVDALVFVLIWCCTEGMYHHVPVSWNETEFRMHLKRAPT